MAAPILILCLGNEILSDDGFGPEVARHLLELPLDPDRVEVLFAPIAGFALIQLMNDRRSVLVVDSIQSGREPGTMRMFEAGEFTPSRNLTTSHQISLPTALELGRRLGCSMPQRVDVLAVEAQDVETLHEGMTVCVAGAVEPALEKIQLWLSIQLQEEKYVGKIAG